MRTSDTTLEITKALIAFQNEDVIIEMTRTNPFFNSKYADLGDIKKAIKNPLARHGLAITQFPTSSCENGIPMVGVTARLIHDSGEWMEETALIPLDNQRADGTGDEGNKKKGASPAQKAGIAITYLRRYAINSILNLFAEDDNDGNMGALNVSEEITNLISTADKVTKTKYLAIVKEFDESGNLNNLSNLDLKKVLEKMKKV